MVLVLSLLFFTSWVCWADLYDEGGISPLTSFSDWRLLESYNETISRSEFEEAVRKIYSPNGEFFKYLDLSSRSVKIYGDTAKTKLLWELRFARGRRQKPVLPYHFQPEIDHKIRGATPDRPLYGLVICLDPGHIGGEWGNIEERRFRIRKNPPIVEGDLNMITCQHLAPLLEKAGARIVWTHRNHEPVTRFRPLDFQEEAIYAFTKNYPKFEKKKSSWWLKKIRGMSELLFYRTSEIQARAKLVNEELKPDLTLCVHYNATAWRRGIRLREKVNRIILFVHGSYSAQELAYENYKFNLMRKLLERSSAKEIAVAEAIANQVQTVWKWPPQGYDERIANRVSDNPYVWSRDLLANRLYNGPVVFIEGPHMNDREIYKRLIAGDYDGEKEIGGKKVRSIMREFAEIIAQGVVNHYKEAP